MCGIAGILTRDLQAPLHTEAIYHMLHAMRHRGPDGQGLHQEPGTLLGHCRLAIIDLHTGQQPMGNEDGSVWVLLNGEIYNYRELRSELAARHDFVTESDTEVLIHLYEEYGEACLDRLNGMFAFAIWDARQHRLFAARDRFGIKPFYWMQDHDRFVFASEPKAFFAAGLREPGLDMQGLQEYISFQFCIGARTMFAGINQLEPGCYLTVHPQQSTMPAVKRYWDVEQPTDFSKSEADFSRELYELLENAIHLQLQADVPIGAHLSGGLDSTSLVCLASKLMAGKFHTFTGAFREGADFDESNYARQVAAYAGVDYHETRPGPEDLIDKLPWLIYMMDEPAAGPGIFPQYYVSRLASDYVKVVLGGQGGDELFGGYARYLIAYLEQVIKGVIYNTQDQADYLITWSSIAPNLTMLHQYQPMLQRFWQDGLFGEMDARYFRLINRSESDRALFTANIWHPQDQERVFSTFRDLFNHPSTPSYYGKMTRFDIKTVLPALLHVEDRTSMSVSIESRVPYLDHRIAELVLQMPPAMRFKGGDSKHVLREAVKHRIPGEIYSRRDKMGFPVPLDRWAGGPLRDFLGDILLSERARQRGLYQMPALEHLIMQDQKFGRDLWGILCLELWQRAFFDGDQQFYQTRSVPPEITLN